ncbi:acyl carrier protein [Streptomyces xiaopingdaonensis]|uniref:acyl carrier protein n=1 Tax=Streptomyces xiaopingdaonensis TaxID=1565415 RepID=UPI0002D5805E|nr:acyl carrier protein [Streptomyces xiaopingdaonensis]
MTIEHGTGTLRPVTAAVIEEILTTHAGVPAEALEGRLDTPLEELGVDSLAVLELEAVVADRHGLQVPEGAVGMGVNTIVDQLTALEGRVG